MKKLNKQWSKEDIEYLKKVYSYLDNKEIAKRLGRSWRAVNAKANVLGIKKSEAYIQRMRNRLVENGKTTRFDKGHVPAFKGTKGVMKPNKTSFKKGHRPYNWKPVGSERVTVDGYIEVKTKEPRKWELKHRLIWEKYNGEIPEGHNVQFKNGNSQDVRIENLYLIDKAGNMLKNSIKNYPEDLQKLMIKTKKLKRIIHKKEQSK